MEPTWKLRRIGILSAVKTVSAVAAALGFIIGTIWGFVFAFFSSVIASAFETSIPASGPIFIIVLPIAATVFYAVLGAVGSFFAVLLYNIAASLTGGIELELGFERKAETGSFI